MALTSGLNPNLVKTALDEVFFSEFDLPARPEIADANDPNVFMQMPVNVASVTMEEYKGVGDFEQRGELQTASSAQPQSLYNSSFTVKTFARGVEIPKRFMDDEQWGVVDRTMRDFGDKARVARNKDAFSVYRDNATLGDGAALFATTHPIDGGTQSNLITPKLSESALDTAIIQLAEMKERDGTVAGHTPNCLVVPFPLFKNAALILESELRSGTANNDMNFYSSKYGILLKTSVYLGDVVTSGDDNAWYLLARRHAIYRFDRMPIDTRFTPWDVRDNRAAWYDAEFRQAVGALSYIGAVKSSGTTGSVDA